jgi:hypothetical protein
MAMKRTTLPGAGVGSGAGAGLLDMATAVELIKVAAIMLDKITWFIILSPVSFDAAQISGQLLHQCYCYISYILLIKV